MRLMEMSFSGAVMILALTAVRAFLVYRLPKRTFLALWGIVLVRLLLPYRLPSLLSVYSLAERLMPTVRDQKTPLGVPAFLALPMENAVPAAEVRNWEPSISVFHPWTAVWLTGVLACTIFFLATYLKCCREFRASLPVDNAYIQECLQSHRLHRTLTVRQSDRISAPLTYGTVHPVILLPKTTNRVDPNELKYILAHEYIHICRFDTVTKLILTAAVCVHWCNPTVWIMYTLANRDLELSCDEAVIRMFGEHEKRAYALTLLHMEDTRNKFTPLSSHFSKNAMEERILAIMKTKKTSQITVFAAAALIVGVTAVFATSARTERDNSPAPTVTQNLEPLEVTNQFFAAFQNSDYETMKQYCTESCQETYFHDGDVFGMVWAKATDAVDQGLVEPEENLYAIFVNVDMETAASSALYGETQTSFYVLLTEKNDEWRIDSFVTGL